MSKHTDVCPAAHGNVCHFQHHRENPQKPFIYQSPNFPGYWRVAVKQPNGKLGIKTYMEREDAFRVAHLAAVGDYTELDAA